MLGLPQNAADRLSCHPARWRRHGRDALMDPRRTPPEPGDPPMPRQYNAPHDPPSHSTHEAAATSGSPAVEASRTDVGPAHAVEKNIVICCDGTGNKFDVQRS